MTFGHQRDPSSQLRAPLSHTQGRQVPRLLQRRDGCTRVQMWHAAVPGWFPLPCHPMGGFKKHERWLEAGVIYSLTKGMNEEMLPYLTGHICRPLGSCLPLLCSLYIL